ncbi:MAG: hypothetical protein O7J95_18995 [Planctomycetota bacterium]|nr:hypothetical protein [Planctomycetota bacterium]
MATHDVRQPKKHPSGDGPRVPQQNEDPQLDVGFLLENMERMELVGERVRLSDGREGTVVHVEYESPERVALVKTYPETPSPLTRVGVDRLSPVHLPHIAELLREPTSEEAKSS